MDSFELAKASLFVACLSSESLCETGQRSSVETAAQWGGCISIQTLSPYKYYHMKSETFSSHVSDERNLKLCQPERHPGTTVTCWAGVKDPHVEKLARISGFLKSLTTVMHISEQEGRQGWTGECPRPTVTFSTDIKAIWLDFINSLCSPQLRVDEQAAHVLR